ncbi:unnamed protein product [Sphagnum jensenii]|uniref:Uncharacterized protein n=1 Tax=Sphagnum jensenii TaxID=128206 RepID=A0ABP0VDN5_9BRYO
MKYDKSALRVTLCEAMLQTLKKRGSFIRTAVAIDEKIVYHDPVNNKDINAGWIDPNDYQPVVYRRTQFSPKMMVVAAMSFTGKSPTSVAVLEFLLSTGVIVLHQTLYSPDTNPLDLFAFRTVEEKRHRQTFSTSMEVENHVTDVLTAFSLERLHHEFSDLVDDLNSIVNRSGDYL